MPERQSGQVSALARHRITQSAQNWSWPQGCSLDRSGRSSKQMQQVAGVIGSWASEASEIGGLREDPTHLPTEPLLFEAASLEPEQPPSSELR